MIGRHEAEDAARHVPVPWGWLEIAALLVIAAAAGHQVFGSPIIGLANNGDFARIMGWAGLSYPPGTTDLYMDYVHLKFIAGPIDLGLLFNPASYVSTSLIFVLAGRMLFAALAHSGATFDIRFIGAATLVVYLFAIWVLLWAVRRYPLSVRIMISVLAVLFSFDVALVAYLNSFYDETASLVGFILVLGLALHMTRRRSLWLVLAFVASSCLLVGAKTQNLGIAPFLAAFLIYYFWQVRLPRVLGVASAAAVLVFAGYMYAQTPKWADSHTSYDTIFNGVLAVSPNPAKTLKALGFSPTYAKLKGSNVFYPPIDVNSPSFVAGFYKHFSYPKLALYYFAHPSILLSAMVRAAGAAQQLRPPGFGNFVKGGGPPQGQAQAFSWWSTFQFIVFPAIFWVWVLQGALGLAYVLRRYRSAGLQTRLVLGVFVMTMGVAVISFGTSFFGDGFQGIIKHLFLFDVVYAALTVFVAAWALRWCVRQAARRAKGPTGSESA